MLVQFWPENDFSLVDKTTGCVPLMVGMVFSLLKMFIKDQLFFLDVGVHLPLDVLFLLYSFLYLVCALPLFQLHSTGVEM